ncbi:MAG: acylphosphatase [Bacillota bacterium]|nr:acylphosphatase [Bacillota bacterium]
MAMTAEAGGTGAAAGGAPAGDGRRLLRVHLRIRGRVQGVGFRAGARAEAERLGVTGWVRNAEDGSVELEAQAEPEALERFLRWCQRGPAGARVDAVDSASRAPVDGERGFAVRP